MKKIPLFLFLLLSIGVMSCSPAPGIQVIRTDPANGSTFVEGSIPEWIHFYYSESSSDDYTWRTNISLFGSSNAALTAPPQIEGTCDGLPGFYNDQNPIYSNNHNHIDVQLILTSASCKAGQYFKIRMRNDAAKLSNGIVNGLPSYLYADNSDEYVSTFTAVAAGAGTTEAANPRIFVTASTYSPQFAGSAAAAITAADAACMADSNKPNGGGTFKAMIASSSRRACSSANCTNSGSGENSSWVLHANKTYYQADGSTVIGTTTAAGVFSFPLTHSLGSGFDYVMTGLAADWTTSTDNCSDWTTGSGGSNYRRGYQGSSTSTVIEAASPTGACSTAASLYCVEQ